ncbi:MAG TPA: hypothetical protein VFN77_08820 [Acetobacteraceae bacterium]|nr:hypothetical protein [Acetobacteraceae bacterium]
MSKIGWNAIENGNGSATPSAQLPQEERDNMLTGSPLSAGNSLVSTPMRYSSP